MPSVLPVWRGARGLTLQPGFKIRTLIDREEATRVYKGPYSTCFAKRPPRWTPDAQFPSLYVQDVTVEEIGGGIGRLTIELSSLVAVNFGAAGTNPTYKVRMVEISKHIYQNPRYQAGGAMPLLNSDLNA